MPDRSVVAASLRSAFGVGVPVPRLTLNTQWVSVGEVAARLNVSRWFVTRRCQDGTFTAFHAGRQWRIDRESVDAWIMAQRFEAEAA